MSATEMYHTSVASKEERQEILKFLERQLLQNAWLIENVCNAFQWQEDWVTVLTCRRRGRLVGVACTQRIPERRPGRRRPYDYWLRIDAASRQAVDAILEALPRGETANLDVFSGMLQRYFGRLETVKRREDDLYFRVSPERFRPVAGNKVIQLTEVDARLFEGCEHQPNWENKTQESRLFGIMADGKIVTSVWTAFITPREATTQRVASIGALYTETAYRRRGLGRRLVSYVSETILGEGNLPIYWTEPDNIASQRLCKGLGYWQYAQKVFYLWRKP